MLEYVTRSFAAWKLRCDWRCYGTKLVHIFAAEYLEHRHVARKRGFCLFFFLLGIASRLRQSLLQIKIQLRIRDFFQHPRIRFQDFYKFSTCLFGDYYGDFSRNFLRNSRHVFDVFSKNTFGNFVVDYSKIFFYSFPDSFSSSSWIFFGYFFGNASTNSFADTSRDFLKDSLCVLYSFFICKFLRRFFEVCNTF